MVGAPGDDDTILDSGAVYVFTRTDDGWIESQKLKASDGASNDYFGTSVSMSGDTIVVGASLDDDGASMSGSAYVYVRVYVFKIYDRCYFTK